MKIGICLCLAVWSTNVARLLALTLSRFTLALLFALAASASAAPAPAPPAPVVLVFGDSLSAAYGIPINSGWVSLLAQRLKSQKPPYQVVNASVSGETTRGGVKRIDGALEQHRPSIVIVELGANDGLRGLPTDAVKDNLDSIIQTSRERNAQVLLVGMRLPPNYGQGFNEKFSEVYTALAKKYEAPLVPFLLEGVEKREHFQADGLHPTTAAQTIMLETVWAKLEPMLKR